MSSPNSNETCPSESPLKEKSTPGSVAAEQSLDQSKEKKPAIDVNSDPRLAGLPKWYRDGVQEGCQIIIGLGGMKECSTWLIGVMKSYDDAFDKFAVQARNLLVVITSVLAVGLASVPFALKEGKPFQAGLLLFAGIVCMLAGLASVFAKSILYSTYTRYASSVLWASQMFAAFGLTTHHWFHYARDAATKAEAKAEAQAQAKEAKALGLGLLGLGFFGLGLLALGLLALGLLALGLLGLGLSLGLGLLGLGLLGLFAKAKEAKKAAGQLEFFFEAWLEKKDAIYNRYCNLLNTLLYPSLLIGFLLVAGAIATWSGWDTEFYKQLDALRNLIKPR
jgi:hypothetical protein